VTAKRGACGLPQQYSIAQFARTEEVVLTHSGKFCLTEMMPFYHFILMDEYVDFLNPKKI